MESLATLLLGMLGILLPALLLCCALALLVGLILLTRLVHRRLVMFRSLPKRQPAARTAALRTPTAKRFPAPGPDWAMLAQCLFWGECKAQQAQK